MWKVKSFLCWPWGWPPTWENGCIHRKLAIQVSVDAQNIGALLVRWSLRLKPAKGTQTEEPWFKRRSETWREGQRSRRTKEPGHIGTSAKGSPLGGCCGDWSHSTCPLCWDQWLVHSILANLYKWGRRKAPLGKYLGHTSCLGFNSTHPRKVQIVQCAHDTRWHLGAGETEKTPTTSENITPVCDGRGKLQLRWEGGRRGCSWWRPVREDSLPTLDNAHSHQDDREGEKGSSSQDGGGSRQTALPLPTHQQVVHLPSAGVERKLLQCEYQSLQHPFPSNPRCVVTELHRCYIIMKEIKFNVPIQQSWC